MLQIKQSNTQFITLVCLFSVLFLLQGLFLSNPSFAREVKSLKDINAKAKSYLLIDFNSGGELASKNPDERVEPASITKLMTAYVLYGELKKGNITKDDRVLISEKAWRMEGSRMFVEAGKKVPLKRLLNGLIIQSGNDAAIALAEHASGSEASFVDKMNAQAQLMGLENTHFANATGWPDKDHYTTARDISKLAQAVIRDFPEYYKLYKQKEFSYNGIKQYNRNKLLWLDPTVDGVKTGHTDSAGFCLVASAKREKMRIISVVLGTENEKDRADISQQLLEYGFRFFETHKLYEHGAVLSDVRVWKGDKETIPVGFVDDFYITVPKGSYDKLKGKMEIKSGVDAPIQRGDEIGKVIIEDGGDVKIEAPILALDSVRGGGFWRKMSDGVQKVFH
jgi:D-alanyl-D-alanine carboxypeptidase (penicillin-binding protein 5/6)